MTIEDDNYTMEEPDEPSAEEAIDEASERTRTSVRSWGPPGMVGLGVVLILLAGWCATEQFSGFNDTGPDKSSVFISALTLPLSIAGALLLVAGVLAFVVHRWNGDHSAADELVVAAETPPVADPSSVVPGG